MPARSLKLMLIEDDEVDAAFVSRSLQRRSTTDVDVITWAGRYIVHEQFTVDEIRAYRAQYPDIEVIAHPECSPEVCAEELLPDEVLLRLLQSFRNELDDAGLDIDAALRMAVQIAGTDDDVPPAATGFGIFANRYTIDGMTLVEGGAGVCGQASPPLQGRVPVGLQDARR